MSPGSAAHDRIGTGHGPASPARSRIAAAIGGALLGVQASVAAAQQPPDRAATLRALATRAAALLEPPPAGAVPGGLPPELADLAQRLAPPEPMDYYWARADALVEEALRTHRPDLVAGWQAVTRRRLAAATRSLLAAFREALEGYALDHGRYPPAWPGLAVLVVASAEGGPYLGTGYAREDGWGRPLVYRPRGEGYELLSAGPDGREGSDDDVR